MDDNKKFKAFDRVLVRDEDDKVWTANKFSHYREGCALKYVCVAFSWKQCIPYKGNEYLLGTDKSPKCEREEPTFLQKVIAWNPGFSNVRGYFLDKITIDGGKIRYKVINIKTKDMEYFQDCVAEEWEE